MMTQGPFAVTCRLRPLLAAALLLSGLSLRAQWTAPTPEELAMTTQPQVPGAPAVFLFKEELADDSLHMQSFYVRLKVLTEGGKDYANVELPYVSGVTGRTVDSISGRTIQPDGTIVLFTGKPYEKVVEKFGDYKVKVKVFSLPAVAVGSIIEYRYKLHLDDQWFSSPDWIIQSALYTRKAHYMWRPTDRELTTEDGKQVSSSVAWLPILPPGAEVKQTAVQYHRGGTGGGSTQLDLDVHDIPPLAREQFMPPMQSLSYKVLFYYTSVRSTKEYWITQGKSWSKAREKFMNPGPAIKAEASSIAGASDTPAQKLTRLYAMIMTLENTDFTRQRSTNEERAQGLKEAASADDILTRKRGSGDQLTELFVSLARAAGMKAYLMAVANRDERFFLPGYLSMRQFDDYIAVVNVGGKDEFFDPGQRFCGFGQLSWKHALTAGLRQIDGGVDLANTPGGSYKDNAVKRLADLKLDEHGEATGTVVLSYTGASALTWRQDALRGDETSLHNDLHIALEKMLPGNMEIKVTKVDNLTAYEQPLKVTFDVKGAIGQPTGKRLLVPANLFESNSKPKFPETKREQPIDMRFPSVTQDAVRLTLPPTLVVESAPPPSSGQIPTSAEFDTKSATTANSITFYRNFTVGKTMFGAESYPDLRAFYGKIEAKDQEPLVLTHAAPSAPKAPSGGF